MQVELLGHRLLQQGFRSFFLYLFNAIEGREFIIEPLHEKLFDYFEDIINGKITRANINICPRSAKTTFDEYFVVYTFTICPQAQIIYTSYSQSLLSEIANKVASIMESPIYKALFPYKTIEVEEKEATAIDDFWRVYLFKENKGNTYSNKLIKTYAGGVCLFSAVGSQITGFGAGVRNSKKFSGFLTIDDGNKPADIHSQVLREKAVRYFEETLLSRLNNPNTPIINIQQRLHLEDLSGILIKKYGFDTLKVPLLDENGVCNLPSQYTEQRIKELQINNYMFSSQYQQEPIILGGAVIKREWFNYYDVNKSYKYSKIVIAGDTAMSVKEHADKSCFLVGGIAENNNLHILDCVWGKWEYPELKQQIINLWNKWQLDKRTISASALFIEEKSSGIQVLQELKKSGIPILPLQAEKDKLTRVEGVLDYIASGMVYLPDSEIYGFNGKLLAEWESFTRDNSHLHDDATDTLCYLINKTIAKKQVSLLEVL